MIITIFHIIQIYGKTYFKLMEQIRRVKYSSDQLVCGMRTVVKRWKNIWRLIVKNNSMIRLILLNIFETFDENSTLFPQDITPTHHLTSPFFRLKMQKRTESRKCLFRYNHSAYAGSRSCVRKGKAGSGGKNKIVDILGNPYYIFN